MSVGLSITKQEIDQRAGDIARGFQRHFNDTATLQSFLAQTADADLIALGYTAGEVAILKSAFLDLTQLATVWSGAATQGAPKDFRTFVRQVWGVGAF